MEKKEFKKLFDALAKSKGFSAENGYWCLETSECIFVIDLQKSNFGNHYFVNIKVFIQGAFGRHYVKSKQLKNDMGDIIRRPPAIYDIYFDLDSNLNLEQRKIGILEFFEDFLFDFSRKALSRKGVLELENENQIVIPPGVKKQLISIE